MTIAKDAASGVQAIGGTTICGNTVTQPQSWSYAKADPVTAGGTGTRYFATDTRGTIWQDTAAAVANPIVAAGTVAPVQ